MAHSDAAPNQIIAVDDGARIGAESALPTGITWIDGIKPFNYARNVNRGVEASIATYVVVMGDDVEVITPRTFDNMEKFLIANPTIAILSPAIHGFVGNDNQRDRSPSEFRSETNFLAFVCVMIPIWAWRAIGTLDERFSGYGCEDLDYCWRARDAGLAMGVLGDCKVSHGQLSSSFRERPNFHELFEHNKSLFREKWNYPLP